MHFRFDRRSFLLDRSAGPFDRRSFDRDDREGHSSRRAFPRGRTSFASGDLAPRRRTPLDWAERARRRMPESTTTLESVSIGIAPGGVVPVVEALAVVWSADEPS